MQEIQLQPLASEEEEGHALECRICAEGDTPEKGQLFRPCHCITAFIHESCLERWREQQGPSRPNFMRCEVCHYKYRLERVWFARWLTHPAVLGCMTTLLVTLTILLTAWILYGLVVGLAHVNVGPTWCGLSWWLLFAAVMVVGLVSLLVGAMTGTASRLCDDGSWGTCPGDPCRGCVAVDGEACLFMFAVLVVLLAMFGIFLFLYSGYWCFHQMVQAKMQRFRTRVIAPFT